MPVGHDLDGDGVPFHYVDNTIHTIFFLKGDSGSIVRSIDMIVNTSLCNYPFATPKYDNISIRHKEGYIILDVETNNFIPQLFDEIRASSEIENVLYVVYAQDFDRLITNDRNKDIVSRRSYFELPVDYEIEIDDNDDMFPEEFELSISEPNE